MTNKGTANFSKMKMVEEQELIRLIEKQLRQYDPAIRALANITIDNQNILANKNLSADEKFALLNSNQQRFVQLKSIPDPVVRTQEEPAAQLTATMHAPEAERETDEKLEFHDALSPSSSPKFSSTASLSETQQMDDFLPLVSNKYTAKFNQFRKFLDNAKSSIRPEPQSGEIVLNGSRIPNSSYHDLLAALYERHKGANLTGQKEFLQAIRNLVRNSHQTGWPDVQELSQYIPRTSIMQAIKAEPAAIGPSRTRSGTSNAAVPQKGQGFPPLRPPPGRQIKALYLYK